MRILCLLTDAYGGHGGIAVYNRDIIEAFCQHPAVKTVTALPRKVTRALETMPDGLDYRVAASRGGVSFLKEALGEAFGGARPDLIYCAHVNLSPVALALRARWGAPVLTALYGIEAWKPTGRRLTDKASLRADRYYAISRITQERFSAWSGVGGDRIDLLPNAIHLDRYGPAAPSPALLGKLGIGERRAILTFGRLVSQERAKGFDEILDVMPELLKHAPDLVYVIAGDGDDRGRLEAKAAALGLADHVIFTGYVDETDKADLYRAARVYAMPSRGEGFGFVFLEALANGAPCVGSLVDGSRDALRDGTLGALVDPDDQGALIEAIMTALDTPRGVPGGLTHFAFPAFCERVHGLVDRMTTPRRAAA